ncbi:claudin-3-like [Melanotaenia boesemani]|uniref:claudin-3-like n=1 Tax=Melanotaenia boesemani TaxID=1250792 RepID=UPI001C04BA9A|nr:claudin-3-like [Melanotaenia boesemani]
MGKQVVPVALGVLGLIGVIVCCVVPQWIVVYGKLPNDRFGEVKKYGLWMECALEENVQLKCRNRETPLASTFHATKAMLVISCMLTCLSLLILLIQSFDANCIPYLQNEDAKPKIYPVVGWACCWLAF